MKGSHFERCRRAFIHDYLVELMDDHDFCVADAVRFSGMSRSYLHRLLKQYGISWEYVLQQKRRPA